MHTRILRFAPSPNGHLHLGHAHSALLNQDMTRELGGRLLLRIEDIDATRCRPAYEAAIVEDLHWLGVTWEVEVRRQSAHFDDYQAALSKLEAAGLVYPRLREPERNRCPCRRARRQRRLAARSGRRATLSG
jgi:glutamyl-Q tRNA(Asp) synthetase